MELWVVVTNARSWGKGESFKDALSNAFKEAGPSAVTQYLSKMSVVKFDDVTEEQRKAIGVSEIDGSVNYPSGLKPRILIGIAVPVALRSAFSAWDIEVEGLEYGPEFTKAFED